MRDRFRRRRRRRGLRRLLPRLLTILLIAFAAWLGGLFYFAALIPDGIDDAVAATDGIVVLTGGSDRLREGLRLLADGKATQLLISGVHREATLDDLLKIGEPPPNLSPQAVHCCITIGYQAGNTAGNAAEAADWAAAKGIRSLRLVTADYHMPRSLLEFSLAMPDVRILPHPVFPDMVKRDEWWLWPGSASLVVSEYHKYAATRVRGWIDGLVR
jgi:uncharacterized SAM-binding protein YcdF (DUF218 family)